MTTQLPLDDRATCAELFDFACALETYLREIRAENLDGSEPALADLLDRFQALRDDINEGENT